VFEYGKRKSLCACRDVRGHFWMFGGSTETRSLGWQVQDVFSRYVVLAAYQQPGGVADFKGARTVVETAVSKVRGLGLRESLPARGAGLNPAKQLVELVELSRETIYDFDVQILDGMREGLLERRSLQSLFFPIADGDRAIVAQGLAARRERLAIINMQFTIMNLLRAFGVYDRFEYPKSLFWTVEERIMVMLLGKEPRRPLDLIADFLKLSFALRVDGMEFERVYRDMLNNLDASQTALPLAPALHSDVSRRKRSEKHQDY
jgi:hypothetical protein